MSISSRWKKIFYENKFHPIGQSLKNSRRIGVFKTNTLSYSYRYFSFSRVKTGKNITMIPYTSFEDFNLEKEFISYAFVV